MASAKYTVLIPAQDELGQPLKLAQAAHEYLAKGNVPIVAATVHPGHPLNALTVWAEDEPKIDSAIKQLGDFVGEIANVQSITVAKSGKNNATWTLANRRYQPGVGAERSCIADKSNTDTAPHSGDNGLESHDFPPSIPDSNGTDSPYPSGFAPPGPNPLGIS